MKRLGLGLLFGTLILTGCGGGGGGGGSTSHPVTPPIVTPPAPVVTITSPATFNGLSGTPQTFTLTASGGTPPYTWTTDGLTQGFTMTPDGVVSGTSPSFFGGMVIPITFRVTDSATPANVNSKMITLDLFGFSPDTFMVPQVATDYSQYGYVHAIGGLEPIQWSLTGTLPSGLTFIKNPAATYTREYGLYGTPTQAGHYTFSITATDSSSPARTMTKNYAVDVEPAALHLPTSLLPTATVGTPYTYSFTPTGGAGPFHWSISNDNGLPPGLNFDSATGVISGTPTSGAYSSFSVSVGDQSAPQPQNATWYYWLLASPNGLPSRNDSIANATVVYPGTYVASISPYGDPAGTTAPDQDYYSLTAAAGSVVRVSVDNQVFRLASTGYYRTYVTSTLDPVLELVDANGRRLQTCNDPLDDNPSSGTPLAVDPTPNGFDDACMNWGGGGAEVGAQKGAYLTITVPGTAGTNTTFYIHVFDWRGDARPDMFYTLTIQ